MMYERMLLGTPVSQLLQILMSTHIFCVIAIDTNTSSLRGAMADVAPVCRHNDQHL